MGDDQDDGACPICGGEGVIEDCFEDTCVCLDPPCIWKRCDCQRPVKQETTNA